MREIIRSVLIEHQALCALKYGSIVFLNDLRIRGGADGCHCKQIVDIMLCQICICKHIRQFRSDGAGDTEFIGTPKMNIMETELVRENGKYYVKPFGSKIVVDGEEGKFILGVRPENMVLAKEGEHAIPCTLEVNEMMGSELHLHVFTEDGTRLIVRVPTIDLTAEERAGLVRGKKLFISFEGKVMHFFDKESQKNLLLADE